LEEPGKKRAEIAKLKCADMKNNDLIKCMANGFLDDPELMMETTAALSQWHTILWPFQYLPQIAHASTIGST